MSDRVFLDSNVLLYEFDYVDRRKQGIARRVVETSLNAGSAVISYQVVQEVLHVLTRKVQPAMTPLEASDYLTTTLDPLWRVQPSSELMRSGVALQGRYGFSFYDSLIVAAALSAGCSRLLTEDLQHGQRIEALTIENPFLR